MLQCFFGMERLSFVLAALVPGIWLCLGELLAAAYRLRGLRGPAVLSPAASRCVQQAPCLCERGRDTWVKADQELALLARGAACAVL